MSQQADNGEYISSFKRRNMISIWNTFLKLPHACHNGKLKKYCTNQLLACA
jgi:hypothetical protein